MFNTNEKVEPINVAEEVSRSFLDYSMSVIISRALPDARDGLKPSQRRILFAMHDLSLFPGRQHRKCAKICGDTSGNYHPHGEAVIYPTLVHMMNRKQKILTIVALVVFGVDFYMRTGHGPNIPTPSSRVPFMLSIVGVLILLVSGWLGGELVYRYGLAVNDRHEGLPDNAGNDA